jgi:hypothetical protein
MNTNVKCPNCQEVFKVDDAIYNNIVKQVRDQQFDEELKDRLALAENEKKDAIKIAESNIREELQKELDKKTQEINDLKLKSKTDLIEEVSKKEDKIRELQSKLENAEAHKKLEMAEAIKALEKQKDELSNALNHKNLEFQLKEKSLVSEYQGKLQLKDQTLQLKNEEIERLKDFKQKQSTKMLGETLELHCENSFNQLRATGFQNAYFEKDNDASGGTKGDYIYQEEDEHGNEIMSIMFEMKNENDQTATKKKNEDFFAKLDKDRNAKNCEYAVLVSMLESDSDYYNMGIVDVSHKYPKMYVVRPQFFIPIITLLRNAGKKSLQYKAELNAMRNQNIDISNFQEKLETFKTGFAKNYLSASKNFEKAIEEIDKSIKRMEAVKAALTTTANQLRHANNKADDLTIKKLTYNNPTMKEKFDGLNNND